MRQTLYILSIVLACLFVTAGMGVLFLQSGRVQTAAVRLATDELQRGLGTRVEVGHVRYRFPARLQLDSVYVGDRQGDTLLYAGRAYAHFSPLALLDERLSFRKVVLSGVRVKAYRDGAGEYNYQFLVNAFGSRDTTAHAPMRMRVHVGELRVEDALVRYDSMQVGVEQMCMAVPYLSKDSMDVSIGRLSGYYSAGKEHFRVERLDARVLLNDTLLTLPRLYVRLPHSELDASGVRVDMPAGDTLYLRRQAHEIGISVHVNRARLTPADIAAFVPELRQMHGEVSFSADIEGQLDSLRADNLELYYNGERLLTGNVATIGLPAWDAMYLRAECEDLFVRPGLLQDLISDLSHRPYRLPDPIRRLGNMHYRGLLEGRMPDMRLRGAFRTALGVVTTDGSAHVRGNFDALDFEGRITTRRFQLGKMLAIKDLGSVSASLSTRGHLLTGQAPDASVHAEISEVTYRGYTYHDISLRGDIREDEYEGSLRIDDDNISLTFNGLADMSDESPNLNFDLRLDNIHPGKLRLTQGLYEDVQASMATYIHISGSDIQDLTGYVVIDSLHLRNGRDSVLMRQLKLTSESDNNAHKHLLLTSDYLTARLEGGFDYTTLPQTLGKLLLRYVPNALPAAERERVLAQETDNQVDIYLYGHQLQKLQKTLRLPVRVGDYPVLKAFVNESTGQWGAQGYISQIRSGKTVVEEVTLSAMPVGGCADMALSANYQEGQYVLHATACGDSVGVDLTSRGEGGPVRGDVHMRARVGRYADQPLISLHVLPSSLLFRDSLFRIDESHISYTHADTTLVVSGFRVGGETLFVEADGVASPRATDSLRVHLGDVNAGYVLPFVLDEQILTVGGRLNGWATLYGLFSSPMFEADVLLREAEMNETPLGEAQAKVSLDRENHAIVIDADVRDSVHQSAHVDGLVDLTSGHWGIDILPDSFPVGFIGHWTSGFLDNVGGTLSGHVSVSGQGGKTWVIAEVKPEEAHLRVPFTGCTYSFRDSVFMDSTSIRFSDMTLYDEDGNPMKLNAIVNHESFTNFRFKVDIRMDKALALNLPEKAGELIQGKVYGKGDVHIEGDEQMVRIDANATTVGDSRFRMSIAGASSAEESNFITFVDHNAPEEEPEEEEDEEFDYQLDRLAKALAARHSGFRLSLNIDITPELMFQLVLNDRTQDMISARGDGALRLTLDENNDVRLLGTYTLMHGTMGFTLANMIRRDFTIAEGSQIVWNGVPENPQLNVTAKYRVTASLRDLFGDELSTLSTSRTSIPVNTCVTMTGTLDNPTMRFGIELPMSEEAIQSQVQSVINTEEMLMRQVVYLLVFKRFYTPEYMQNTSGTFGLNETYSLLSSTITGQINSWISRLTDAVTFGVNIRSEGEGSESSQEYEAQFQIQPIRRLIINGNFGYRYNDITNRPFFGDLDVEYVLTPNGKLRAKAYTHTVDKYSLRQASTIQGVGLVFKHDFNWRPVTETTNPQKK